MTLQTAAKIINMYRANNPTSTDNIQVFMTSVLCRITDPKDRQTLLQLFVQSYEYSIRD